MNILAFTSKFPIFFTVVILTILLIHNIRKSDRIAKKNREDFYSREVRANSTRRKSLETVDYIVIPYDSLPMDIETDDEIVSDCIKELNELKEAPIANFTGITNTDLKLEYGAPNIGHLTRCDNDFTILVRILQDWAKRLHELGHDDNAISILEFAIKSKSDVSATYYLAAKIYYSNNDTKKIAWLKRSAEALNSMMSTPILRTLNEKYPDIPAY